MRVYDYHCAACRGDRPQVEEFPSTEIAIVRSGVFGVRTDRHTQLLTTGFLLLGNAGQAYEISHDHGGGDRCLVFSFDEGCVEEIRGSAPDGPGGPFAVNVLPPLSRAHAIRQLADERLHGGVLGLEEIALALVAVVLDEMESGTCRGSTHTRRGGLRDRIFDAVAYVEQRSAHDLSLGDLAASAGVSPFHFVRQFKSETGVTPYRFLVQTRIRCAITLLRDTADPITDIAHDVGFGDLSNFIHTFRREVGCSPRQFRVAGLPAT